MVGPSPYLKEGPGGHRVVSTARGRRGGRELRHGLEGQGKGSDLILNPLLSFLPHFKAAPSAKATSLSSHGSFPGVEMLGFLTPPPHPALLTLQGPHGHFWIDRLLVWIDHLILMQGKGRLAREGPCVPWRGEWGGEEVPRGKGDTSLQSWAVGASCRLLHPSEKRCRCAGAQVHPLSQTPRTLLKNGELIQIKWDSALRSEETGGRVDREMTTRKGACVPDAPLLPRHGTWLCPLSLVRNKFSLFQTLEATPPPGQGAL